MMVDMPLKIRKILINFEGEKSSDKILDEEAFKTETRITLGTKEQNKYLIESIKEF
ncbi:MAG: hypothetical protein IPI04_15310 [Ignavibacteria bacterium]|nr:hypothetical protein [Ignavibacteria bacterium]